MTTLPTVREDMYQLYKLYQSSSAWRSLCERVRLRDHNVCTLCGKNCTPKDGSTVHHKSYDNWGKGNWQEEDDVQLVCKSCHKKVHLANHVFVPFFARRKMQMEDLEVCTNSRQVYMKEI